MNDKFDSNDTLKNDLSLNEISVKKGRQPLRIATRVLVLILAFVAVAFSTLFIADLFSTDDGVGKPDVLTVTVLGDSIGLSNGDAMSFPEFEAYIEKLDKNGDLDTVALITDTANPPDVELYNQIVSLMEEYGIEFEEIAASKRSSQDEMNASADEVGAML